MKGQLLHWTTIILLGLIIFVVVMAVQFGANQLNDEKTEVLQLEIKDYQAKQELNQALRTNLVYNKENMILADAFAILFYDGDIKGVIKNTLESMYGSEDLVMFYRCKGNHCEVDLLFDELTNWQLTNDEYFDSRINGLKHQQKLLVCKEKL